MSPHRLTDVGAQTTVSGSRYSPGCWGGWNRHGCNARVPEDDVLGLCPGCRQDILGEGAPVEAGS